ncbi:MAG: hypothetical protein DI536_06185 [Archangium gephyra]|uniref:Ankyrin repeat domain-containing protein n=1 Tax=Archangium gephyra TaxID=48 RepID=A0A2W5TMB3_9BACT|nr:MAG: hypothetical protein DI536_06185 [Archangium gephyra]
MRVVGVIVGLILLFSAWMYFHGRYFVEDGRAPWAVINDRSDVLAEALKNGVDGEQKRSAMRRALSRHRHDALKLLLADGMKPDLSRCELGGDLVSTELMLDAGATAKACDASFLPDFIERFADDAPEAALLALPARLVKAGADVNGKNFNKLTAGQIAKRRNLTQLATWLDDPTQPVESGTAPKPALHGTVDLTREVFAFVCEGEGQPNAPAYEREEGLVSPMLNFERRTEKYFWPGRMTPGWWSSEPKHAQLVVCATITEKKVFKRCTYEGGGGGITLWEATYELVVREARTARELAKTTVSLLPSGTTCDFMKLGKEQEGVFPDYAPALRALVEPLVVP